MLYEGLKVLKTMMVTAALSATLVVGADAAELKGGIVDTGTLNFRSAPSESAPIIDKLYNGYRVCILDVDENGWASISINGNPGYVSAEYLDVLDVMDVNGGGAKVTASALNVRFLSFYRQRGADHSAPGYSGHHHRHQQRLVPGDIQWRTGLCQPGLHRDRSFAAASGQ